MTAILAQAYCQGAVGNPGWHQVGAGDIATASGSVAGALSSGDWTTFNGKAGVGSACGANQFETADGTSGPTCAQPSFSNLSGTAANNQLANSSVTVTAGAGLGGGGAVSLGSSVSLNTDSTQASFLAAGALTCGSGTAGKIKVHTTPLQYCDNAATPTLQYAAYGDSTGKATGGSFNYVASVATNAPITGGASGSNAAALTLGCTTANGSTTGCLSSTDWTTFNGKAGVGSACGSNQFVTGDGTGGPTCAQPAFSNISGTLTVGGGGTGGTTFGGAAAGGLITSGTSGTGAFSSVPAVAAGSFLVSNGTATNAKYLAIQSCTSSSATTCTITVARSGCVPICGPGTTAAGTNGLKSATVSSTTLTCTFLVSGSNTCNCICP